MNIARANRTILPALVARRIELSAHDALCCVYLVLPLALFLLFFASSVVAGAGLSALAVTILRVRVSRPSFENVGLKHLLILIFGAALCLLIGIFPLVSLGSDWIKHYVIYNLLIEREWPVLYGNGSDFLRYYFGLYLVPALTTKVLGRWSADICLFVWIWLGLVLFLQVLLDGRRGWRALLLAAIFVIYGGADIIGTLLFSPTFQLGQHIEWWAQIASMTSHSVMLAWVPQHALPGWLIVAMLMRRGDWSISLAGPILAAACFWSPFTAIGLVPFFLLRLLEERRIVPAISLENLIVAPILGIPIVAFLAHGAGDIVSGPIWATSPHFSWGRLLVFYLLEFLTLGAVLSVLRPPRKPWLIVSLLVLLTYPLYKVGLFNDFAMRATLPALAVLVIVAAETLVSGSFLRAIPIALLLIVGTGASVSDLYGRWRGPYRSAWKRYDFERVMAQHNQALRNQYLAPYPHWTVR